MLSKARFALVECGGWSLVLVLCLHRIVMLLGIRSQADAAMHFSGGVAITYVTYKILGEAKASFCSLRLAAHLLVAFSLGCTTAVGWVLMEFASDVFFGT